MFKLLLKFLGQISLAISLMVITGLNAYAGKKLDFELWHKEQHIAPVKVRLEMENLLPELSNYSSDQQFRFWAAYCDVLSILEKNQQVKQITQQQLSNESVLPPVIAARIYNCLARYYISTGKIYESEKTLKKALKIAIKHEDLASLINIKADLGRVLAYRSQFNNAHKQLQKAFQLSNLKNDEYLSLYVKSALGVMYFIMGDYKESLDYFEDVNQGYVDLGYDQKHAYSMYFVASNKVELGQLAEALAIYEQALVLAEQIEDTHRVADIHINMAKLYLRQNNIELAERHFKYADGVVPKRPLSIEHAMLADIQGALHERKGNIPAAGKEYNVALDVYKSHGALEFQLPILEKLFLLYERTNTYDTAYPYLKEYLALERYLFKQEVKEVSQEIRGELELAVTEAENKELQADIIGQQKELDQQETIQRLQVGLLILFIIICLIIAISLYKQRLYGKQMQKLALVDELTLIPNRRATLDNLSSAMSLAKRTKQKLTVGVLDIDYFKKVNDKYGHAAGDQVLKAFSQTINFKIRSQDRFGRIGGEEFCLVMPNTSLEQAEILFERILEAIRSMTVSAAKGSLSITTSAGLAELKETDADVSGFLHRADEVLYAAKDAGRDCFKSAQ